MLRREIERLQFHLGETEIPIGKTDLLRVCGSGYDFWNRWRQIGRIGVTDFDFRFRSFGCGKVAEGFGAYHKAHEARGSLSNTSSLLDSIGFSYRLNVILDH